ACRAYMPTKRWAAVQQHMPAACSAIKRGGAADLSNLVDAVSDESAYAKRRAHIQGATEETGVVTIIAGGNYSKETGYVIEPTVILSKDPHYRTFSEEIFGPVLSVFVYEPEKFDEVVALIDTTSPYALTGAIFSGDRYRIETTTQKLS